MHLGVDAHKLRPLSHLHNSFNAASGAALAAARLLRCFESCIRTLETSRMLDNVWCLSMIISIIIDMYSFQAFGNGTCTIHGHPATRHSRSDVQVAKCIVQHGLCPRKVCNKLLQCWEHEHLEEAFLCFKRYSKLDDAFLNSKPPMMMCVQHKHNTTGKGSLQNLYVQEHGSFQC
jgi:hypothetical protein